MTTNPIEGDNRRYLVLVNARNQPSLWPADIPAPSGWRNAYGEDSRGACADYMEMRWAHCRPDTLAEVLRDFLTCGYSAPSPRQVRGDSS